MQKTRTKKMYNLLAVFIGSGLGGVCRWALGTWLGTAPMHLGTLAANVLGCLLLGFLTRLSPGNETLRLLLMAGFCGGFTTFSTFINENLFYMRGGQLLMAVAYAGASLVLGLLAAWCGYCAKL